ncbi:hypothetical protein WICMUC_002244 [Wickerhamomyces mucosus]|uniref:Pre-rRNA-processing protein IPI3 n=1 Tax=Wickerhamomyces mucosus TaxID=1378264 RepID=A0A9P8TDW6_9ASCO|nr:hypothetical protein WICMUC_002244 [Wickerhamomyces mucosus]
MEEIVFYNGEGTAEDKSGALAIGYGIPIHSQTNVLAYRQCASYPNGAAITGTKPGDRVFAAAKGKALINVYTYGKESPDQKIPIPEQLTCLTLVPNKDENISNLNDYDQEDIEESNDVYTKLPKFRIPYLLVGGGISGKIYTWELASGLLLSVKEAHYQSLTVLKVTSDNSYLVSAGKDSRVLVWRISDLVEFSKDEERVIKPAHVISDHSLEVTDIFINNNTKQDSKLYTVSKDSTIRVYSLYSFELLSTFVITGIIESIAVDSADRAIFVGLQNGNIRQIDLYEPNKATNILEAKGGAGKILTLPEDHELKTTITYHNPSPVKQLALSLDGSLLVSGDASGKVVISDIVSKQVVKELKDLGSPVANIKILTAYQTSEDSNIEKNNKAIPPLKRVITTGELKEQEVVFQKGFEQEQYLFDLEAHLNRVSEEALYFENLSSINSEVITSKKTLGDESNKVKELEQKVAKATKAYTDLRVMYEDLYKEHTELLGQ